jgi:hypothetical protein
MGLAPLGWANLPQQGRQRQETTSRREASRVESGGTVGEASAKREQTMSDTPRTDAHNWNEGDYDDPLHSMADFAMQLERELNEANERIKRLEEENDAMRADLLLWKDWEGSK